MQKFVSNTVVSEKVGKVLNIRFALFMKKYWLNENGY